MKTLTTNGKRTIILGVLAMILAVCLHVGIFVFAPDQVKWLIFVDAELITAIIFFFTGTIVEARKE